MKNRKTDQREEGIISTNASDVRRPAANRCAHCHSYDDDLVMVRMPRGQVFNFCADCGVLLSGALLTALENLAQLGCESRGQVLYLRARHELVSACNPDIDTDGDVRAPLSV
jgi:hypothetical protein